jgi:hypothetical protein
LKRLFGLVWFGLVCLVWFVVCVDCGLCGLCGLVLFGLDFNLPKCAFVRLVNVKV